MSKNCATIHQWFNGMEKHNKQGIPENGIYFNEQEKIPENGIYILFEKGEFAHSTNRIVRIGTHKGDNNLRSRLHEHFLKENKDRSIFRKNIGRAFLNKYKNSSSTPKQWEIDLTTKKNRELHADFIDSENQTKVEKKVTEYIQDNFSFVVFQVDDKNKRLEIEKKLISTVSLCDECKSSKNWLGLFSPKEKIRESGLWNVQHIFKENLLLSDEDMAELKQMLNIK